MIHTSAAFLQVYEEASSGWWIASFFDGAASWANGIFVMISGALFLEPRREVSIRKLYCKNILHLATVFLSWSLLYATAWAVFKKVSVYRWFGNVITGEYHMWFIHMLIGLYILVPILRKITADEKTIGYFLIISGIFVFLIPTVLSLPMPFQASFAAVHESRSKGLYLTYWVVHFVGGYYLSRTEFSVRQRRILYAMGGMGFLMLLVSVWLGSCGPSNIALPSTWGEIYSTMMGVGIFALGKYQLSKSAFLERNRNRILRISKYTLGSYMVHALFLEAIDELIGFDSLLLSPFSAAYMIPAIVLSVFFASLGVSYIANHVPFFNKYIV